MVAVSDTGIHNATVDSIAEFCGRWAVGQCRSRLEKSFAADAEARGLQFFLPLVRRHREYAGRRQDVMLPLFPSYVFFCSRDPSPESAAEARYAAMSTNRLCAIIPVVNQRRIAAELLDLERVVMSDIAIDLYPFAAIGQLVRVRTGPLQGILGKVVSRDDGKARVVIQVSMLGQGATLELDLALVEEEAN